MNTITFLHLSDLQFGKKHLFQIFAFPEFKMLVAGFNSCIREFERKQDHYGWIGVPQARQIVQRCDTLDPDRSYLLMAALHHNFLGASNLDNENPRDRDQRLSGRRQPVRLPG
jgi:hypothetical protein